MGPFYIFLHLSLTTQSQWLSLILIHFTDLLLAHFLTLSHLPLSFIQLFLGFNFEPATMPGTEDAKATKTGISYSHSLESNRERTDSYNRGCEGYGSHVLGGLPNPILGVQQSIS